MKNRILLVVLNLLIRPTIVGVAVWNGTHNGWLTAAAFLAFSYIMEDLEKIKDKIK